MKWIKSHEYLSSNLEVFLGNIGLRFEFALFKMKMLDFYIEKRFIFYLKISMTENSVKSNPKSSLVLLNEDDILKLEKA